MLLPDEVLSVVHQDQSTLLNTHLWNNPHHRMNVIRHYADLINGEAAPVGYPHPVRAKSLAQVGGKDSVAMTSGEN